MAFENYVYQMPGKLLSKMKLQKNGKTAIYNERSQLMQLEN